MGKRSRGVKVIHNAPKKRGKVERRVFASVEEALEYLRVNKLDGHRLGKKK